MTAGLTLTGFADDPIASHSARFPLARPLTQRPNDDVPSPVALRPWNLRAMRAPTGAGRRVPDFRYDHGQQVAVTMDGRPVVEVADPTATSVSDNDGDEGRSEDWTYDFAPDVPFPPA